MHVTRSADPDTGDLTITITVPKAEDPKGYIQDMLDKDRFRLLLEAIGRPLRFDWIADSTEMANLLIAMGWMEKKVGSRLGGLMLAARDQFGMGWGEIATCTETPRQTVKSRILRLRKSYADLGAVYTPDGGYADIGPVAALAVIDRHERSDRDTENR